jgi:Tol biopolymer transport system component
MSRKPLNRPRCRTTHRQVRTERMPQSMDNVLPDVRAWRRPFDAGAPVPSPDGTQIAFGARPASGQRSLWVRHVSSAEVRQVADTAGAEGAPFWSADSRWLAFFAQGN